MVPIGPSASAGRRGGRHAPSSRVGATGPHRGSRPLERTAAPRARRDFEGYFLHPTVPERVQAHPEHNLSAGGRACFCLRRFFRGGLCVFFRRGFARAHAFLIGALPVKFVIRGSTSTSVSRTQRGRLGRALNAVDLAVSGRLLPRARGRSESGLDPGSSVSTPAPHQLGSLSKQRSNLD